MGDEITPQGIRLQQYRDQLEAHVRDIGSTPRIDRLAFMPMPWYLSQEFDAIRVYDQLPEMTFDEWEVQQAHTLDYFERTLPVPVVLVLFQLDEYREFCESRKLFPGMMARQEFMNWKTRDRREREPLPDQD